MSLSQTCPQCRVRLRVPDEKVGQTIRCPKCGHAFTVTLLAEPGGTPAGGAGDNPVAPADRGPGWEVIDKPPAAPIMAQVVEDEPAPIQAKPRKLRKPKNNADSLETISKLGIGWEG